MKRLFCSLLAALLLLTAAVPALCSFPAAAEEARRTATFSSPALCADTGEKIRLSLCDVQFENGEPAVPGENLSWTDADGKAVTEITAPAQKGIVPLSVTDGKQTRTVYLVAKAPADTDYVLYENDFSSDPAADLRVVQQTSGSSWKWDSEKGTLVLNASNSGDGYVRVLFPAWLDVFGDAVFEADLVLSNPNGGNSRWGSLMFRVQNKNYPYMQACLRYGASASNGLEIAQRTEANKWNVIKTAACSAVSTSAFNHLRAEYAGGVIRYLVGGKQYLSIDTGYYRSGSVGLQVRGLTMTADCVRVCVNPEAGAENTGMAGGFASVTLPASNISLAPSLLAEVRTEQELASAAQKGAAVAVMEYGAAGVSLSGKNLNLDEVIKALGAKVIPAFRTPDAAAAEALAKDLKKRDFRDAMLLVTDASVFTAAYAQWNMLHGIWDASSFTGTVEELRYAAVSAGIRAVILPKSLETRTDMAYLQDRYLVCYARCDGTDAEAVRLCNLGISGLIMTSPDYKTDFLTAYYDKNTLTRYPNVIGHRGIPSQAQENSLAGCIKAFDLGACMVENDIYLCRDNVLMVMHDSTIDRTTDGTGSMTAMTSKQLAQYRINTYSGAPTEPIPSLEDYFKQFKGNGKAIVIELKDNNTSPCKKLAEMISEYGMIDQVVVISFHEAPIRALRQYLPGISAAWLNSSVTPNEDAVMETLSVLTDTLLPLKTVYSPSYAKGALGNKLTNALFARGITTWAWTVNDRTDFDRYFVAGTRGITTNYANWAGAYFKNLNAVLNADGTVTVTGERYNAQTSPLTSGASLRVVDDGGTGVAFDAATGRLTGKPGRALVFFSWTGATSSGTKYAKVTELMALDFAADGTVTLAGADTPLPGTDPAETGDDSAPAPDSGNDSAPASDGGDNTAPAQGPDTPAGKSGCGSSAALSALLLPLAGLGFCLPAKRHEED